MRELYTSENMGEEQYHIADGTLLFEPSFVEVRVRPGAMADGRVALSCAKGAGLVGYVTSSNLLMHVRKDQVIGNPAQLQWYVDATYLEAGTEEEGFFRVLCNHGEYKIPFRISVVGIGERDKEKYSISQDVTSRDAGSGTSSLETAAPETTAEIESPSPRPSGERLMELAGRDWQGALRVYYSKNYEYSIRDESERLLYRGLSGHPGNEQNFEEYLMTVCAKEPVKYHIEAKEIRNELIGTMPGRAGEKRNTITRYSLPIHCEGWGYIGLQVEFSGKFLQPAEEFGPIKVLTANRSLGPARGTSGAIGEKQKQTVLLTSENFIGGTCMFSYQIDRRKLHAGRNYGAITLRSPYQELRIPVEVTDHSRGSITRRVSGLRQGREIRRTLISIMRVYEQYRIGKIKEDVWFRQESELVRRLQSQEGRESIISHLYMAQLYIMEGSVRRAILELETARRRLAGAAPGEVLEMSYAQYPSETDAAYCYRQYLTAIAYDDSTMITPRVTYILHDRHRKNPSDWRIAMLMMGLSGEYPTESEDRWAFLKKLYRSGSRSPFLYLEAWEMIKKIPGRLLTPEDRRSGSLYGNAFEQSVLLYAMRRGLITQDVMKICIQMADRARGFKRRLFVILTSAYEMDAMRTLQRPILQSVCSMICRNSIAEKSVWKWLSRGIERGLSIIGMEELYMKSLPEDMASALPDAVIRRVDPGRLDTVEARGYFYKELYHSKNRFPKEYERNKKDIRKFIGQQIEAHRMSENLAELYSACLHEQDLAPKNVGDLTKLSYINILRTTNMGITRAIVLYAQESKERSYTVTRGNCMFPVYGKDNRIFLEDRSKNRFAVGVPYTCDPVMKPVHDEREVSSSEIADLPFAIEVSGVGTEHAEITQQNLPYYEALLWSGELQPAFKAQIGIRLLHFYLRDKREEILLERIDRVLKTLDLRLLTSEERREIIRLMATVGRSLFALDLIMKCGTSGVDAKTLALIAVRADKTLDAHEKSAGQLQEQYAAYRTAVGEAAHEAFLLGCRTPGLLNVLTHHFEGFTYELENVSREISGEENIRSLIDEFEIRIVRRMLFTGAFVSNWESAISGMYTRGIKYGELADAMLEQYCHYVFSGQIALGDPIKKLIEEQLDRSEISEKNLHICALAYLRTASAKENNLPEREQQIAKQFEEILVGKNIIFPFYRDLEEYTGIAVYPEETLLEYRDEIGTGRGEGHIVVHYLFGRKKESKEIRENFAAKEMTEMYTGFYVSSFHLFCGEEMQYYITDDAQETNIVESGTLAQDARIAVPGHDRFHMLNRVARAEEEGDRKTALKLLGEFSRADMLIKSLFTTKDGMSALNAHQSGNSKILTGEEHA